MARTFGEMGIREIQTGLAAKEFSAAEVARGTFERIGEADGAVHAFLETTEELALDAAARIDARIGTPAPALEEAATGWTPRSTSASCWVRRSWATCTGAES